ncbi:MAG: nucleoside deaminase [Planctomycetes bacterium]|nr:nucleoside deaminase [Planctomycetota bacterium]
MTLALHREGDTVNLESAMKVAIGEAEESLRQGNKGFGAVIVKDGNIIAKAHDWEETDADPTSHAEINAIKISAKTLGKNLAGCILLSTSEPCPMCAFAIAWSGIREMAYGYSIADAMAQGRRRIAFPCPEAFDRAGIAVTVHHGILQQECSVLYRADVRKEIENLRNADDAALRALNEDSAARRTAWFHGNKDKLAIDPGDPLQSAYGMLVERFRTVPEEMPVVERAESRIVFHSMNFCPTLEACRILRLDTRHVCKCLNEASTNTLVKQIDGRLRFSRNYKNLRPYASYCEEAIHFEGP